MLRLSNRSEVTPFSFTLNGMFQTIAPLGHRDFEDRWRSELERITFGFPYLTITSPIFFGNLYATPAGPVTLDITAQNGKVAFADFVVGAEIDPVDANATIDGFTIGPNGAGTYLATISASVGAAAGDSVRFGLGLPALNEIQRITFSAAPASGTYTITYDGQTTGNIDWNASADTIKTALEGLNNIGVGEVAVTHGTTTVIVLTFQNAMGGTDLNAVTCDTTLLQGADNIDITNVVDTVQDGVPIYIFPGLQASALLTDATDVMSLGVSGLINLIEGDEVHLYFWNETTDTDIEVSAVNLSIVRVA